MNPPPNREVVIFSAALELPAAHRGAYLQEACADDPALRLHIEDLLRVHEQAGAFMETTASEAQESPGETAVPGATISFAIAPSEKPGDRIGRYKLLQQIGEGGCGVVYMAEQEEPVRRRVALKVIKLGMDTKQVIARFEAERQALALMDHPNIARVFDAGATETGRPYFVMELVKGVPITRYCDENNLGMVARLGLFVQVCQAIQHAHQKGIIHRDIKPSNVLVADHDAVPVPKIIDFGIAKATTDQRLTDKTLFTALEQFIGTPAYMSPEQAKLSGLDIDTRSDIYSLGVLLYELLTGKTPFEAKRLLEAGLDEIRRIIREEEPPRPSTRVHTLGAVEQTTVAKHRQSDPPKLLHLIRGDLDWIVMKALDKDRGRRYETANGMAMDIQRHLNDEPVVARPPSNLYRFRKMVRRNRLVFAGAAIVAFSLILGLGVSTVALFRVRRDDLQIRKAKEDATEKLWASYLAESLANRNSGRAGRRFAGLDAVLKAGAIRRDLAVRNEAIACLAQSDIRLAKHFTIKWDVPEVLMAVDGNLERYAVGEGDGNITVRAVADDRSLAVLPAPGFILQQIRGFSPDSKYLSARYWHEFDGEQSARDSDWIWNVEQQKVVVHAVQQEAGNRSLPFNLAGDFSPDSRLFASSRPDGTISLYDLDSGKELKRLAIGRRYTHVILEPGNSRLACSSDERSEVDILETESGRNLRALSCPGHVTAAAWSSDGKRLATACDDFRIYLWDTEDGHRQSIALEGHAQYIMNLSFNHTGNVLASAGFDGFFRLWNPDNGRPIATFPGSSWGFNFSADDRYLGVSWDMHQCGLLEVVQSRECRLLCTPRHAAYYSGPDFSADGRILAAGTENDVCFWDTFSGKEIGSFPLRNCDTHLFHPDGRSMFVTDRSGGLFFRPLEQTGNQASLAYRLGKPRPIYVAEMLCDSALSLDGRHLAVTHEVGGESFVFDLQNLATKPVVLHPHPAVDHIAISPDGRWVATASWHDRFVKVWDAHSGDLVHTLPMPNRATVAFSPEGRWLATSTTEYQLWEVGSWQPKGPPTRGYRVPELNVTAFSPDGRMMARTTEAHNIQLLETLTAKPLATLEAPGSSRIGAFHFSPDGTQLGVLEADQQVQLWDLRLIRQELEAMGLDWEMPPYPPIDKRIASGPVTLQVELDPSDAVPVK